MSSTLKLQVWKSMAKLNCDRSFVRNFATSQTFNLRMPHRTFASLASQSNNASHEPSISSRITATVGSSPSSSLQLSQWNLTQRHILVLNFIACVVMDSQQRKCSVIFDLSCNLTRVLEFCTHEIPQAFLSGADTNLHRLMELIVFILNYLTLAADPELFALSVRRPGQNPERVNRGMILAPLAGIILNLLDASTKTNCGKQNDFVGVFASMDCPNTVLCGFQSLLEYNWAGSFRVDTYLAKLKQLEEFSNLLIYRAELREVERTRRGGDTDGDDSVCCICYACEAGSQFVPCSHISCFGCISRHLLNCQRCFFCNATIVEVVRTDAKLS